MQNSIKVWLHNKCSKTLPKWSLWDFLFYIIPNHLLLAGTNNRNVIIIQQFHAAPLQINWLLFFVAYWLYVSTGTHELLENLLGISPSVWNPHWNNNICQMIASLLSLRTSTWQTIQTNISFDLQSHRPHWILQFVRQILIFFRAPVCRTIYRITTHHK